MKTVSQFLNNDLLLEYSHLVEAPVPMEKMREIRKGLKKKYGKKEYKKNFIQNTFGFDVEFSPGYLDTYMIRDIISSMEDAYNSPVSDEWDDFKKEYIENSLEEPSYSDIDDWVNDNPEPIEPEEGDFEDEESYDEAYEKYSKELSEWADAKEEVENEISDYENFGDMMDEDYGAFKDAFIDWFIDNEKYKEHDDYFKEEVDHLIDNVVDGIRDIDSERYDEWVVEDDSGNLEVASPVSSTKDIPILKEVLEKLYDYYEAKGDTSAHIHIGVPEDFDMFDIIALYDLVDESKVVEYGRAERFTQRKYQFFRKLLNLLHDVGFDGKMSFDVAKKYIEFEKFMGVNVSKIRQDVSTSKKGDRKTKNVGGKTIEFRYPSSRILQDVDNFMDMIQYFMKLVQMAKSRNRVVARADDGSFMFEVTREGSDVMGYRLDPKAKLKQSGRPASILKDEENLSKNQKLMELLMGFSTYDEKRKLQKTKGDSNLIRKFIAEHDVVLGRYLDSIKKPLKFVESYVLKNNLVKSGIEYIVRFPNSDIENMVKESIEKDPIRLIDLLSIARTRLGKLYNIPNEKENEFKEYYNNAVDNVVDWTTEDALKHFDYVMAFIKENFYEISK